MRLLASPADFLHRHWAQRHVVHHHRHLLVAFFAHYLTTLAPLPSLVPLCNSPLHTYIHTRAGAAPPHEILLHTSQNHTAHFQIPTAHFVSLCSKTHFLVRVRQRCAPVTESDTLAAGRRSVSCTAVNWIEVGNNK